MRAILCTYVCVCYDVIISPPIQNFMVLIFATADLSVKFSQILHHEKISRYMVPHALVGLTKATIVALVASAISVEQGVGVGGGTSRTHPLLYTQIT